STLTREAGILTRGWPAVFALRILVNMSAMLSVDILPPHHDAFFTPGTWPCEDRVRKQMRQMPNLRMYERGRPHRLQRLCCETACLWGRSPRLMVDFLANVLDPHFLKGNPSSVSSARASSSVRAGVTNVTSRPRNLSILSYSISGNTSCSRKPRV